MTDERQMILHALSRFIAQRPGLDPLNYDRAGYASDSRAIARDLHDARELLAAVGWRTGIGAVGLKEAFDAFSGRLSWDGTKLDYCTGQYWPTEYRKAVCAVLTRALWHYWRADLKAPDGSCSGDDIRAKARQELSRGVASRWFN